MSCCGDARRFRVVGYLLDKPQLVDVAAMGIAENSLALHALKWWSHSAGRAGVCGHHPSAGEESFETCCVQDMLPDAGGLSWSEEEETVDSAMRHDKSRHVSQIASSHSPESRCGCQHLQVACSTTAQRIVGVRLR